MGERSCPRPVGDSDASKARISPAKTAWRNILPLIGSANRGAGGSLEVSIAGRDSSYGGWLWVGVAGWVDFNDADPLRPVSTLLSARLFAMLNRELRPCIVLLTGPVVHLLVQRKQEFDALAVGGEGPSPIAGSTARSRAAWALTSLAGIANGSYRSASVDSGNSARTARTLAAAASTAARRFSLGESGHGKLFPPIQPQGVALDDPGRLL